MRKSKKRECLVRGNKVFFYGDMAEQVLKALKTTGLTAQQFITKVIKQYERSRKA